MRSGGPRRLSRKMRGGGTRSGENVAAGTSPIPATERAGAKAGGVLIIPSGREGATAISGQLRSVQQSGAATDVEGARSMTIPQPAAGRGIADPKTTRTRTSAAG